MAVYIIEHLEPKLYKWCLIEYESISKIVGKNNLWFSNVKNNNEKKKLIRYGKVINQSIKKLTLDNKNACILDPEAKKLLTPKEAKKFKYFILGGILGDFPARKRTKKELTKFIPRAKQRNIGKEQFSTDNAVLVVNLIEKGRNFKDIKTIKNPEIKINDIESIILPFTYVSRKNKPFMSRKIIKYLKRKKNF